MNNKAEDEWFDVTISHNALDLASVGISTFSGNPCIINWGDGVIQENIESHITSYTHTFETDVITFSFKTANGLQDIKSFRAYSLNIVDNLSKFQELTLIRELYLFSPTIVGNTAVLGQYIEDFWVKFPLLGDLNALPSTLLYFVVEHSSANITGNWANLPPNIKKFEVKKSNITGQIIDLPDSLEKINLYNNDQNITGIVGNIPLSVNYFRIRSKNTIGGNIGNIPNSVSYFEVGGGNNIISGSLDDLPSSILHFHVLGDNAISGTINSLNPNMNWLIIAGLNTISGDIANLPANITNVTINGNNTISGNIHNCYTQYLTIIGNNSISGNLGSRSINKSKQQIYIGGNNDIQNTSSKDYSGITNYTLILNPVSINMIPNQVDQLLISTAIPGLVAVLRLYGASRTSASDAAVATIINNGGEVTFIA